MNRYLLFLLCHLVVLICTLDVPLRQCPSNGILNCSSNSTANVPVTLSDGRSYSISNCIFVACPTLLVTNWTVLNLSNVTFSSSITEKGPLVFEAAIGYLNAVQFNGNIGDFGGALSISYGSNVSVNTGNFISNSANFFGGAISVTSANFNCVNCTFSGNFANETGGAIDSYLGTVSLVGGICKSNSAGYGGCIHSYDNSTLSISNGTEFSNNYAIDGGVLFLGTFSSAIITGNINIRGNQAVQSGGAFFVIQGSILTVADGTTLINNYAGTTGGCIMLIGRNSSAILSSSVLINCTAMDAGGAGYLWGSSSVILTNGSVVRNSFAMISGGAFYLGTGALLRSANSSITNGKSGYGGAILLWMSSNCSLFNTTLANNIALYDGGAVFNQGSLEITSGSWIFNNTAGGDGGAISNVVNSLLSLSSPGTSPVVFESNTAGASGSSIYAIDACVVSFRGRVRLSGPANDKQGSFFCFFQTITGGMVNFISQSTTSFFFSSRGNILALSPSIYGSLAQIFMASYIENGSPYSPSVKAIAYKAAFSTNVCKSPSGVLQPFKVKVLNSLGESVSLSSPENSIFSHAEIFFDDFGGTYITSSSSTEDNGSTLVFQATSLDVIRNSSGAILYSHLEPSDFNQDDTYDSIAINSCYSLSINSANKGQITVSLIDFDGNAASPSSLGWSFDLTIILTAIKGSFTNGGNTSVILPAGQASVTMQNVPYLGTGDFTIQASVQGFYSPFSGWPRTNITVSSSKATSSGALHQTTITLDCLLLPLIAMTLILSFF